VASKRPTNGWLQKVFMLKPKSDGGVSSPSIYFREQWQVIVTGFAK
jgi:hypothetical protein